MFIFDIANIQRIDYVKVADELGFKNHRSAKNKVLAIKKKFNLPLGSSNQNTPEKAAAGSRKVSEASGPNEPAVPKTPSKQRVTKPRITSSTKKKATSKAKKNEIEEVVKVEAEDEDEEAKEEPVDKEKESKAAYEEVFGKPDPDEDEAEDEDEYA